MGALSTARRDPASSDLAELVRACGRDERPALEALYRATAPELFGRALARGKPAEAERALLGTYLDAFAEAAAVDPEETEPRRWLETLLERHLPEDRPAGGAARAGPVEPEPELWERLDIALGLRRLDRHIKPGVAAIERGRDPMPNHNDRRRDRRLAAWRTLAIGSLAGLVLAGAAMVTSVLREDADAAAGTGAQAAAVIPPAATAILQPPGNRRVWRVDRGSGGLAVRALPAFVHEGEGVLALWARAPDEGAARHLGDLDPATTTELALPDELLAGALLLFVTLEAAATASAPLGPTLFSGRLED